MEMHFCLWGINLFPVNFFQNGGYFLFFCGFDMKDEQLSRAPRTQVETLSRRNRMSYFTFQSDNIRWSYNNETILNISHIKTRHRFHLMMDFCNLFGRCPIEKCNKAKCSHERGF